MFVKSSENILGPKIILSQKMFEGIYFSKLGEGTIKKAKSLSKLIQFENDSPLIAGSGGNVYSIIPDLKHELYCYCIHDNSPCEGWKFSTNKPKECKHILSFRINQGQTIAYEDKQGNKKSISNTDNKKSVISRKA